MVLSPKEYIEANIGSWVLADPEFNDQYNVLSTTAKASEHLDGFMAAIYMCDVVLQERTDQEQRTVSLVVKVMKGTQEFRDTSKSFVQCSNEVFVYEKVIPYLKRFVKARQSSIDTDKWTPKIYHLFYGKVPELSLIDECILAMENVSVSGFKNGPRVELDMAHLSVMLKTIAEFHAVQYAMRIEKDPMLETLKQGLTKLHWKESEGSTLNLFEVLYPPAFDRMFDYLDRNPEMINSDRMKEEVNILREKFGKDPVSLLETFGVDDDKYSVILHGDYNRNNVLFKYSTDQPETPIDLRMIDFQEVRYASPAIDLFFFFYMSTTAQFREKHWDDLLHLYHKDVWQHLKDLLNCDDSDERLQDYSYDNFQKHFSRYAFYGTMVTIHFLPWLVSNPEELEPLANEFTNNMKSEKCREMLLSIGGDMANEKVAQALQHAVDRGYISFIKDL